MKVNKKILGALIRAARKRKGISQMKLAECIGVTYQQIQKYESGKSEVSVTRLYEIAEALGIPVTSLLAEEIHQLKASEPQEIYGLLNNDEKKLVDLIRKINNKRLTRIFVKMLEEIINKQ
ncbi:MAG TPA: XRE family transcriptional regulator [Nitrospirae bacterium]|nr:XRE family transcriptional regulator [Nitrospirota bacterium]